MQFAFASEWFGICLFEPWWDLSLQQKSVGFWWIFWEGGWISNKRYASRGRRKRVHGSLGGGSVDAWICVSLLGPVSVAACFIYRQLTRLRSAQSDDNVFLECYCDRSVQYISLSLDLDVPSCVTLIRSSTLHFVYVLFRWREQESPSKPRGHDAGHFAGQ